LSKKYLKLAALVAVLTLAFSGSALAAVTVTSTWNATSGALVINDKLPGVLTDGLKGGIQQLLENADVQKALEWTDANKGDVKSITVTAAAAPGNDTPFAPNPTGVLTDKDLTYILTELGGKLTTIDLGAATVSTETEGEAQFTFNLKTLALASTTVTSFTLPGVKTIPEENFVGFEKLETVVLPKTLVTIGKSAFEIATLKKVDFSAAVSLDTIGEKAFSGTALTALDLSGKADLKTIGVSAFENTLKLKTVDLSGAAKLETIGNGAFAGVTAVKADTTADPQVEAKPGTILEEVILSGDVSLKTIGKEAFARQAKLSLPDLTGLTKLTTIGEGAFKDIKKLEEKELDLAALTALEAIGKGAFAGSGAETVKLPLTEVPVMGVESDEGLDDISIVDDEKSVLFLIPESALPDYVVEYVGDDDDAAFEVAEDEDGLPVPGVYAFGVNTLGTYNVSTGLRNVEISTTKSPTNTLIGYEPIPNSNSVLLRWYEDGVETQDITKLHYTFTYDETIFTEPAGPEDARQFLVVRGKPIPTGTVLYATVAWVKDLPVNTFAKGDTYPKTALVEEVSGRSAVTLDLSDLPEGSYKITFTSDPEMNPIFTGTLTSIYEKTGVPTAPATPDLTALTASPVDSDDIRATAIISPAPAATVDLTFTLTQDGATVPGFTPIVAPTAADGTATATFYNVPDGTYTVTVEDTAGVYTRRTTTVTVDTTTPPPSGGDTDDTDDGGSGGCSTGFAGLALLLAAPLFFRKKD
jgi:Synergist-CTERM protein sorting domain-containing protein